MSRKRNPRGYGFTTSPTDRFVRRIAEEAKARDKFIIATAKNVATGETETFILTNAGALPQSGALGGVKLLGMTPNKPWGRTIKGTEFRYRRLTGDPQKILNIFRAETQRIKNFLKGRVLRVEVEAH